MLLLPWHLTGADPNDGENLHKKRLRKQLLAGGHLLIRGRLDALFADVSDRRDRHTKTTEARFKRRLIFAIKILRWQVLSGIS